MATYEFGVADGPAAGSYGLLQNFNDDEKCDLATAKDENGEVAAANPFNFEMDGDFEIVVDTETALPSVGSILDVLVEGVSKNFYVTGIKRTRVNSDYKKASVTLKRWTANNIPAPLST